MIAPGTALMIAALVLALVALVFWPRLGLYARMQRGRLSTERVLIEDALKHLYDREYRNIFGTLESVSGALSISRDRAAKLLARLEALQLIETRGSGFRLTPEGSSYALRIIRVHRLWERYLADETGLAATEWHHEAERLEHVTSEAAAEALASQMGNPVYDPHGDPIPTASGELPPRRGRPLIDLPPGELAQIIHIEDEPAVLYKQLVAQGLHPGMRIKIIDKSAERLRFVADGEEVRLAPVAASNITVVPLPAEVKMPGPYETLASLGLGERGVVTGLSPQCRGAQRRRLMDLGIVPGTEVTAELRSGAGDPMAYDIRGASIALRRDQASLIHIQRKEAA